MAVLILLFTIALVTELAVLQVHCQSTQGFISIDCGIASNYSYTDRTTDIPYVSDDQFIDTGTNYKIDSSYMTSSLPAQVLNLRSFADIDRNCYTLPVLQYHKYLLRATFMYANYDGKDSANPYKPLSFDLHLGIDFWKTINVTNSSYTYMAEVMTVATYNFTSVCLINTGNGVPFISALELRPLKDTIYTHANLSQSLVLSTRIDAGSLTNNIVRFPDDPYDRIWRPIGSDNTLTTISTKLSVSRGQGVDEHEAPSAVLQTALTPINAMRIQFYVDLLPVDAQLYNVLHFTEVQVLTQNATRLFNFYRNGELKLANYTPPYLSSDYIHSTKPFGGFSRYDYSLEATNVSNLPPIINAFELYYAMAHTGAPTDLGDVYAMNGIRVQYQLKMNWMGDPCSPSAYIWERLNCSYSTNNTPRITTINLSSSGLTGVISPLFSKLTALKYLDLSNNSLSGAIPEALGNLQSLQVLILSCNNLTGPVPASLQQRSKQGQLMLRFDDGATNSCEKVVIPSPGYAKSSKINTSVIVVISVVPAMLLIVLVSYIVFRIRKGRGLRGVPPAPPYPASSPRRDYDEQKPEPIRPLIQVDTREFTYNQLVHMSRNFENVIGRGGFGSVYLGYLESGRQVAIKMLSQSSSQGTKEFLAEVQNLARIHHRNLVSLIGYCTHSDYLGLVYEYMPQGSLHDHLTGKPGCRTLSWIQRLRIAVEAAQGLEYLHKGCKPPIIHRDIKTSNILLSQELEAKIADFGLSKVFQSDNQTHVSTTAVVGTPGYVDPEYHIKVQLNEKSDVYSFGVVLLTLVTGQPPIVHFSVNAHITQWVAGKLETGCVEDIVDERLKGEYDVNSAWKVLDIAIKCTARRAGQRPSISDVVMQLKQTFELVATGEKERYDSQGFDMSQNSASEIGGSVPASFGPVAR